jgi:hypothetical protein
MSLLRTSCLWAALTALAAASPSQWPKRITTNPTIYSMDNAAAGASIAAVSLLSNGALSAPVRTSTGGKGRRALAADGITPAGPDSLFTQNSVVVGDNVSDFLRILFVFWGAFSKLTVDSFSFQSMLVPTRCRCSILTPTIQRTQSSQESPQILWENFQLL